MISPNGVTRFCSGIWRPCSWIRYRSIGGMAALRVLLLNQSEGRSGLAGTVAKVLALVDAPYLELDLPLDLRGSELELAVWEALRAIPSGETRSYGAIAEVLPVPATAQEVGAACAANVLAVAVPCHRVVKADGSISGYRWGVRRKRRLINMEGVA